MSRKSTERWARGGRIVAAVLEYAPHVALVALTGLLLWLVFG